MTENRDSQSRKSRDYDDLPLLFEHFRDFRKRITGTSIFFLDFDGTLAPIVEKHDDAAISAEMRSLVQKLSRKFPVAIISGRGLSDVRQRLQLPDLYYAGSHGFEIAGPDNFSRDHEEAAEVLPLLDEAERVLKKKLEMISGVDFERKKYTLAVHYRQVPEEQQENVDENVKKVLQEYPELSQSRGKKVFEIRPAMDWHKGKAVDFLRDLLSPGKDSPCIYLGDDITDEDAFRTVGNMVGILVGTHDQGSFADYKLEKQEDVEVFFQKLLDPEHSR